MEGGQMNSNYVPCNTSNASTSAADSTSHSACCNAANADVCLSSGLCLSTVAVALGRVLWVSGCTDKTLNDPTCPQYCCSLSATNGATANSYFLRACNQNQTVNSWCCGVAGQTMDDCCSRSFKLRSNIGDFVQQLSLGNGDGNGGSNGDGNSANANDGVPFATASLGIQPPPATSTASAATTSATASVTVPASTREGLVAGITVVSAIAAAALIALVIALLRICRYKGRHIQATAAAGPLAEDNTASAAPQVVEQSPGQQLSMLLANPDEARDYPTSHELSPISETRATLNEMSDTATASEFRTLGTGVGGEASSLHSSGVIAELPADVVVKRG
ncbi:hypothetical protein SCUCBS95973_004125 [Sporothrix curviconia]|uniref:Uncharacterized protein n=1 Tax=Sporothrix curviconia TaxID=1260050 RepID=A0ABP0BL56_9PEZI